MPSAVRCCASGFSSPHRSSSSRWCSPSRCGTFSRSTRPPSSRSSWRAWQRAVTPVALGALLGYQRFYTVATLYVLPFALRLGLVVATALAGYRLGGAAVATFLSAVVTCLVAVWLLRARLTGAAASARPALTPFLRYLRPVFVGLLGIALLDRRSPRRSRPLRSHGRRRIRGRVRLRPGGVLPARDDSRRRLPANRGTAGPWRGRRATSSAARSS